MFKIIYAIEGFKWKEIDEKGNSVRVSEKNFTTEEEAQVAIDSMGNKEVPKKRSKKNG